MYWYNFCHLPSFSKIYELLCSVVNSVLNILISSIHDKSSLHRSYIHQCILMNEIMKMGLFDL